MIFHFLKEKTIYLDSASTTFLDPKVKKFLGQKKDDYEWNNLAIYQPAKKLNQKINLARKQMADFFGCNQSEIYFAPSATIANFILLNSIIAKAKNEGIDKPHFILSPIEHPSIHGPIKTMLNQGAITVFYLPLLENGQIDISELENYVNPNTVAVLVMKVNNELGSILPVEEIKKRINIVNQNTNSKKILLMSDYCQFVSEKIKISKNSPDIIVLNSHKLGGPKGLAFVYINSQLSLPNIVNAGNQEKGLFPGTVNAKNILAGVMSFAINQNKIDKSYYQEIENSKKILANKLFELSDRISLAVSTETSPHILSLLISGVDSEVITLFLASQKIYASSKSTCKSDDAESKSHVIELLLNKKGLNNSKVGFIRISLCRPLKKWEINKIVKSFRELLKVN